MMTLSMSYNNNQFLHIFQWDTKYLVDNCWHHPFEYKIIVQTGLKLGAGTNADVCINLFGTWNSTGERIIKGKPHDVS